MSIARSLVVYNGRGFPLTDCPVLPIEQFRQEIVDGIAAGGRLSTFFAFPCNSGSLRLFAVLARAGQGDLAIASADVGDEYAALTPDCPQAHLFEREIFEQWHVRPLGHPWLKPVRFTKPRRLVAGSKVDGASNGAIDDRGFMPFFQMAGEEVHEVAVGPVHAGVIEPGHFRFQCHGETVYHLEISLGYQHRG